MLVFTSLVNNQLDRRTETVLMILGGPQPGNTIKELTLTSQVFYSFLKKFKILMYLSDNQGK